MIIQDGKSITFYIRKLTEPQKWYTVTEKELLGIVKTFKEFFIDVLGWQGRGPGRQILYAHACVRQLPHLCRLRRANSKGSAVREHTLPINKKII